MNAPIAAPFSQERGLGLFTADSTHVAEIRPSPNFGERRNGFEAPRKPDCILLHYTGMPAGRGLSACERATRWLTTEASQVSCHYVVDLDGRILQLVPEALRAWHAGLGAWRGNSDINSASIGIEIVNSGHFWNMAAAPDLANGETAEIYPGYTPFPDVQIEAVIRLCHDIVSRNAMHPAAILAHSDIAPARKTDPGELFPWDRLASAGLGDWVAPTAIDSDDGLKAGDEGQPVAAIQSMLALLGFQLQVTGVFDEATRAVVIAFQRHWRPARVDGVADRSTVTTLHRLLSSSDAGQRGKSDGDPR